MWVFACFYAIFGLSHISWCSAIATIIFSSVDYFACFHTLFDGVLGHLLELVIFSHVVERLTVEMNDLVCRDRDLNTRFNVDLVLGIFYWILCLTDGVLFLVLSAVAVALLSVIVCIIIYYKRKIQRYFILFDF